MVGGPDSGKTNYLARLWEALRSRAGRVQATKIPDNISYVENALSHLHRGRFAPRSASGVGSGGDACSVSVCSRDGGHDIPADIVVPDVSGELWSAAVDSCALPAVWMQKLRESSGALLFVRVASEQNVDPPDWATARDLLGLPEPPSDEESQGRLPLPTAVYLCELLRFLEFALSVNARPRKPRVAVLVTAWDILDREQTTRSPTEFLAKEYPLFAGRIGDVSRLEIAVFGVSVVGGDLADSSFRQSFLSTGLQDAGYIVPPTGRGGQREPDLTLPITWVLDGLSDQ